MRKNIIPDLESNFAYSGKLYLLPTTLGENDPLQVLPISVKALVEQIDHYIVENEKTARRSIKALVPENPSLHLNSAY